MNQLPLALQLAPHADFDTWVDGANRVALAHVRAVASGASQGALWLAGPTASGKSHVLQAACRRAAEQGRRAMYLPLTTADVAPGLLEDLAGLDLVALDDVDHVADTPAWQHGLFEVLNRLPDADWTLLMAAQAVPAACKFSLPDLASRAAAAVVYRLEPLNEFDQITAFTLHARHRGLDVEAEVVHYLQSRVPREMGTLMAWLERLDAASLAAKRRITVPFVREMLMLASRCHAVQGVKQGKLEQ